MNKFISIHKFAKEKRVDRQKVYRWIREGKIKPEDIRIVEMKVKRLAINQLLKI